MFTITLLLIKRRCSICVFTLDCSFFIYIITLSTWHKYLHKAPLFVLFPPIQHQSCLFTPVWTGNIAIPANARKLKMLTIHFFHWVHYKLATKLTLIPLKLCSFSFSGSSHSLQLGFFQASSRSFHFHPAVGLLLPQEPVRANATRYPVFSLCAPPCVYLCSRCVWLCAPLARFVFHTLWASAVLTCPCVFTRLQWAQASPVAFCSIKQSGPLYGLIWSWGPCEMPDWGAEKGIYPLTSVHTANRWHACTRWRRDGTLAFTRKHAERKRRTEANLSFF